MSFCIHRAQDHYKSLKVKHIEITKCYEFIVDEPPKNSPLRLMINPIFPLVYINTYDFMLKCSSALSF